MVPTLEGLLTSNRNKLKIRRTSAKLQLRRMNESGDLLPGLITTIRTRNVLRECTSGALITHTHTHTHTHTCVHMVSLGGDDMLISLAIVIISLCIYVYQIMLYTFNVIKLKFKKMNQIKSYGCYLKKKKKKKTQPGNRTTKSLQNPTFK